MDYVMSNFICLEKPEMSFLVVIKTCLLRCIFPLFGPSCPYGWSVVCHNILKGLKVPLPCSYLEKRIFPLYRDS